MPPNDLKSAENFKKVLKKMTNFNKKFPKFLILIFFKLIRCHHELTSKLSAIPGKDSLRQ